MPHSEQTNSKIVMVTTLSCVLNILLPDTDLVLSPRSIVLNRVAVQAESPDPCSNRVLRDATEDSRLGSRRGQCSYGACALGGLCPAPAPPRREFTIVEFTSAPVDRPCQKQGLSIPGRLLNCWTPLSKLRPARAAPTGLGAGAAFRAERPLRCSLGRTPGSMPLGRHAILWLRWTLRPHTALSLRAGPPVAACGGQHSIPSRVLLFGDSMVRPSPEQMCSGNVN